MSNYSGNTGNELIQTDVMLRSNSDFSFLNIIKIAEIQRIALGTHFKLLIKTY